MYHFVSERTAEVRVSENVLIPSKTTQYLKSFQLEAVRFLYKRLSKKEFCIFNDESGLGKTASVVALLSGLGTVKNTLIVLQNDDQLLAGWQFHLGVLTDLPVCVIKNVNDTTESAHSVYLSKWSILRSIGDLSKLNFDYIIVDHRGYTLNNNFCTSMLLKQFEGKVNIVISSVDITSDVKLLYKVMQLGGCLDHQFKCFRSFESKFHLPDVKEVLSKRVDIEEYYKQRGILGEYIKDYRLRRYRHQFDSYLPLVTAEQYKRNLSLWLGENNSSSTISDSTVGSKTSDVPSTGDTEEIFECILSLQRERHLAECQEPDKISLSEHSDDVIAMEPLILESESEPEVETDDHAKKCSTNVVLLSSDDCEIIESSQSVSMTSNSPAKRKYMKRVQPPKSVELTESETEEPPNTSTKTRKVLNVRLRRASIQSNPMNSVKASSKRSPDSPRKSKSPIKPEPKTPKRDTLPPASAAVHTRGNLFGATPRPHINRSKKGQMYHFVSERTAEVRVSENVLIPSKTTQYLKSFQLEAVRFLYKRLSKKEFCIFNDESGLGKTASVVALLSGLGTVKNTLIVLQNDDQLLAGWQFHLGVLTDLPVCVIKNVNDTTESAHSVYLSKWSILRSIGDLSKLNFDYIIVDHRGYTLNNNFCTSMLLKQFEGKVNIVISSVDITSDVKLLYKVMQLGGCLDHQFKCFRSFESKFHLPDVKEVLSKRVDIEEYYKQRGILGEYIKDYRLRRYRHQFDSYLPLVTAEQYKRNLSLWLGENNSSSTISDSTVGSKTSDVPSTGDTEEIFECILSLQRERHLAECQEPDKISLSEHSDDVIAMEPLILESESEPEVETDDHAKKCSTNVVLLSSDDCEIIESSQSVSMTSNSPAKRKYMKRVQPPKSVELTESETEEPPNTSTKTRKVLNVRLRRASIQSNPMNSVKASSKRSPDSPRKSKSPIKPEPKTPKRDTLLPVTPKTEPRSARSDGKKNVDMEPRQTRGMQRLTRSADSRSNSKYMTQLKSLDYEKKGTPRRKRNSGTNQTPKSSKVKKEKITVKQEIAVTPRTSKTMPMKMSQKEPEAKRTTRSRADKEHFSNMLTSLPDNKRVKKASCKTVKVPPAATLKPPASVPNNERKSKASPKVVTTSPAVTADLPNSPLGNQKNGKTNFKPVAAAPAATPELLSSGSILSDNSYLQCAQKFPENLAELEALDLPEFRVPHAPPTSQLLLPVNLNLLSGSEVAVVPSPNTKPDVVVINSSHDESSQPSTKPSQSRRTRALKRKSVAPTKEKQSQPTTSRFGLMLAQHRGSVNKSPDIFSNCSEASQVSLAQPVPFEGFKIFGSEVGQPQQQLHDKTGAAMPAKRKRERSCLELLEKMFEPHQAKHTELGVQLLPDLPSPKQQLPQRRFTLLDDDIFEITNNGEFGSRLRVDSAGNVSPVQQQQLAQRNKITNYLISSSGAPEDTGQRTQSSQLLRKSPKPLKSTQSTKLTRWFGTAISGGSQSAPSTPVLPTEKADRARLARSAGSKKRKRLVLDK
ncbi:protein suppressor of underreplication [Drosophila navojoa]|uniref:protein suppressor of underreplication n=1 Tax=Drosophila navojoa TaxID=7232 RepID=UPI0011BF02BD|nr:protein suppressor of underreplication [Drosophila navojoa]